MKHVLYALTLLVLLSPLCVLHAQTPCGNIIAPAGWGEGYVEIDASVETTAIAVKLRRGNA